MDYYFNPYYFPWYSRLTVSTVQVSKELKKLRAQLQTQILLEIFHSATTDKIWYWWWWTSGGQSSWCLMEWWNWAEDLQIPGHEPRWQKCQYKRYGHEGTDQRLRSVRVYRPLLWKVSTCCWKCNILCSIVTMEKFNKLESCLCLSEGCNTMADIQYTTWHYGQWPPPHIKHFG